MALTQGSVPADTRSGGQTRALEGGLLSEIRFTGEFYPLILISYEGAIDHDDALEVWDFLSEIMARDEEFVGITDLTRSKMPSKKYRNAEQERNRELAETFIRLNPGFVMILENPVLKLALNMILSINPLPMPYKVVSSIEEAVDTALEFLAGAALEQPDRTRAIAALRKLRNP